MKIKTFWNIDTWVQVAVRLEDRALSRADMKRVLANEQAIGFDGGVSYPRTSSVEVRYAPRSTKRLDLINQRMG